MKTGTIKQTINFKAAPTEVYNLLMDSRKHSSLTGGNVSMSKKVNGKFSIFDGYVHGYNIELVEGEKIVQAWHFAEEGWPDDHYSICSFQFEETVKGTKMTLVQTDIPKHKVKALGDGWKLYYWEPMKLFLEKSKRKK